MGLNGLVGWTGHDGMPGRGPIWLEVEQGKGKVHCGSLIRFDDHRRRRWVSSGQAPERDYKDGAIAHRSEEARRRAKLEHGEDWMSPAHKNSFTNGHERIAANHETISSFHLSFFIFHFFRYFLPVPDA